VEGLPVPSTSAILMAVKYLWMEDEIFMLLQKRFSKHVGKFGDHFKALVL
jgi:hypothetical protein